jgi:hypothetical protein
VCDGLEGERFWLIAQRGRDADWVRNIEHNPRVRVKVSGTHAFWRAAHRVVNPAALGAHSFTACPPSRAQRGGGA